MNLAKTTHLTIMTFSKGESAVCKANLTSSYVPLSLTIARVQNLLPPGKVIGWESRRSVSELGRL